MPNDEVTSTRKYVVLRRSGEGYDYVATMDATSAPQACRKAAQAAEIEGVYVAIADSSFRPVEVVGETGFRAIIRS